MSSPWFPASPSPASVMAPTPPRSRSGPAASTSVTLEGTRGTTSPGTGSSPGSPGWRSGPRRCPVAERLRAAVLRLDTRTPPGRDRALDGLRALAILGVVLGHWMVGALVLGADGALTVDSPLRTQPGLAPASWLLQMLGLFFLCLLYTSPSPRDGLLSRMPSSA